MHMKDALRDALSAGVKDNRDFKQRERGRRRGLQNPQKDWGENAVVAGISKQLSSHYKTPLMMSVTTMMV